MHVLSTTEALQFQSALRGSISSAEKYCEMVGTRRHPDLPSSGSLLHSQPWVFGCAKSSRSTLYERLLDLSTLLIPVELPLMRYVVVYPIILSLAQTHLRMLKVSPVTKPRSETAASSNDFMVAKDFLRWLALRTSVRVILLLLRLLIYMRACPTLSVRASPSSRPAFEIRSLLIDRGIELTISPLSLKTQAKFILCFWVPEKVHRYYSRSSPT
jgi:hypothetical protein